MERKLYEASLTGNVTSLISLLQEDQLILDRISLITSFNETPLHIAALRGHLDFARLLLNHKPKLVTSLDSQRRSPLHLASAEGHVGVVHELLQVQGGSNLCNSRDQDGRTPLHLAAMNEHLEVIKVLTRAQPEVAKEEIVDHGVTVLHLCVTHNRFEALKLLIELWRDEDVAKLVDHDGNTLLHLAAIHKQTETIKYLLNKSSIKANGNAVNVHGFTALDVLDHCPRDFKALETREILIEAGIKRTKDLKPAHKPSTSTNPNSSLAEKSSGMKSTQDHISYSQQKPKGFLSRVWNEYLKIDNTNWLERERGNLIIAATVIAAMTFQAGLHPPGGTYFDSSNGHSAGMAVAADIDMDNFSQFLTFNTVPLIVSMIIILILVSGVNLRNKFLMWVLMLGMFTTFVFLLVSYLQSIAIMSPDMWVNQATAYLCLVWILISVVFAFIYTVCFVVWLINKLSRHVAKKRVARTQGINESPIVV